MSKFIAGIFSLFICIMPSLAVAGSDVYDFSIRPGTPEWKTLHSHEEMIKVCLLPKSILEAIETEDLIETCLRYPLFVDMLAYQSLNQGFSLVAAYFNGLEELIKRNDAGLKLLKIYDEINSGKYDWTQQIYIEVLLSQNDILIKLNKENRNSLLKCCANNYKNRKYFSPVNKKYRTLANCLIMGRITEIDYPDLLIDTDLIVFIKEGNIRSRDTQLEELYNIVYNIIK